MSAPEPPPVRYAIALGGNVGDVACSFARALELLASTTGLLVERVSSFHVTRPVGTPSARQFLNAAAIVATTWDSDRLLECLHEIESLLGRARGQRWDDRPLDLDLILSRSIPKEAPRRAMLPHPQFRFRRFVLDPLVEIAGDWIDPMTSASVHDMRCRLLPRPLPVGLVWPHGGSLTDKLQHDFRKSIRWLIASTPEDLLVDVTQPPAFVLDGRAEWPEASPAPVVSDRGVALARVSLCQTTPPARPVNNDWLDQRIREILAAAISEQE